MIMNGHGIASRLVGEATALHLHLGRYVKRDGSFLMILELDTDQVFVFLELEVLRLEQDDAIPQLGLDVARFDVSFLLQLQTTFHGDEVVAQVVEELRRHVDTLGITVGGLVEDDGSVQTTTSLCPMMSIDGIVDALDSLGKLGYLKGLLLEPGGEGTVSLLETLYLGDCRLGHLSSFLEDMAQPVAALLLCLEIGEALLVVVGNRLGLLAA